MWTKLLLIAAAGAGGTVARYLMQEAMQNWLTRLTGLRLPWGTLPVNALGCFLFGLVWALADTSRFDKAVLPPELRLVILVGFLGAFTTFSTFGFETGELLRANRLGAAAGNVLLQNGVGILLALLGIRVGAALAARALGSAAG